MSYFFIKKPALVVFLRCGAERGTGPPWGVGREAESLSQGALGLPALWAPPQRRGAPLPLHPGRPAGSVPPQPSPSTPAPGHSLASGHSLQGARPPARPRGCFSLVPRVDLITSSRQTQRVCAPRVPAPGHTRVPRLPCTPARPDDAPPAGHRPPRRWSPAQSGFPVTSSGLWVVVRSASDFQIGGRRPGSFLFLLCSRVPERSENMASWSLDASVLALLFTVGGLVVGGLAQARAPSPGAEPRSAAP